MSNKATFASEEWRVLRDTPHFVGMSVAMAGASGLFGTISEMFAAGKIIAETTGGSSELLRAVLERDELKESQSHLREESKSQDPRTLANWVLQEAATHCRRSMEILAAKGAPGEKETYAEFLNSMAKRVADASTEGGFLGFGGERVSAKEREALAVLRDALATGEGGAPA